MDDAVQVHDAVEPQAALMSSLGSNLEDIMDEFTWLVKMLPEGASVTAVLSVVVLFLRAGKDLLTSHQVQVTTLQNRHEEAMKTLTDAHNSMQKESREVFAEQLEKVTGLFTDRHDAMQDKVNTLTEAHIRVSGETVHALNDLRDAVRDLQSKVK